MFLEALCPAGMPSLCAAVPRWMGRVCGRLGASRAREVRTGLLLFWCHRCLQRGVLNWAVRWVESGTPRLALALFDGRFVL